MSATLRVPVPSPTDVDGCKTPVAGRRQVLFVSGDADLRSVVGRVLEREGYAVSAVPHSGHALLLCRTTTFDVLVAELSGPDVSGPSLAAQLRRHCPGLSTIFLGQPNTPEGVEQVLVRPFTRDDLLARLEHVCSRVAR